MELRNAKSKRQLEPPKEDDQPIAERQQTREDCQLIDLEAAEVVEAAEKEKRRLRSALHDLEQKFESLLAKKETESTKEAEAEPRQDSAESKKLATLRREYQSKLTQLAEELARNCKSKIEECEFYLSAADLSENEDDFKKFERREEEQSNQIAKLQRDAELLKMKFEASKSASAKVGRPKKTATSDNAVLGITKIHHLRPRGAAKVRYFGDSDLQNAKIQDGSAENITPKTAGPKVESPGPSSSRGRRATARSASPNVFTITKNKSSEPKKRLSSEPVPAADVSKWTKKRLSSERNGIKETVGEKDLGGQKMKETPKPRMKATGAAAKSFGQSSNAWPKLDPSISSSASNTFSPELMSRRDMPESIRKALASS